MSEYRSIFLEPDWLHSQYYGWDDSWPDPKFRVMSRNSWPLAQRLILNEIPDPVRASALVNESVRAAGIGAEVILHDLTGATDWRALGFQPIGRESRLLNVQTFVIDLRQSEESLFDKMSKQCRYDVRAAQKAGLTVTSDTKPSDAVLQDFLRQLRSIAQKRNFRSVGFATIKQMFADERATLFLAGTPTLRATYAMIYRAGSKAIYLHGASRDTASAGAGKLLQWHAIRTLKTQGVHWYDLGGVPSVDESDGIFRFKKGFGGQLVDLGNEFRFQTPLAKFTRVGLEVIKRLKRAVGS